jgi:hypothetical protein
MTMSMSSQNYFQIKRIVRSINLRKPNNLS